MWMLNSSQPFVSNPGTLAPVPVIDSSSSAGVFTLSFNGYTYCDQDGKE